jgi:gluconokinase
MSSTETTSRSQSIAQALMAICLGVMAVAVFFNVVLRYGFGSGIAASEELSRLLFVWMVFIGATAAYPAGEHMAFTSFVASLRHHPKALQTLTVLIRLLVVLSCIMLGRGAWQQVEVGFSSNSVVLGYPNWLLPLPVLLSSLAIGLMALKELIQNKPMDFDHGVDVE